MGKLHADQRNEIPVDIVRAPVRSSQKIDDCGISRGMRKKIDRLRLSAVHSSPNNVVSYVPYYSRSLHSTSPTIRPNSGLNRLNWWRDGTSWKKYEEKVLWAIVMVERAGSALQRRYGWYKSRVDGAGNTERTTRRLQSRNPFSTFQQLDYARPGWG